jgi:hypothetical protein
LGDSNDSKAQILYPAEISEREPSRILWSYICDNTNTKSRPSDPSKARKRSGGQRRTFGYIKVCVEPLKLTRVTELFQGAYSERRCVSGRNPAFEVLHTAKLEARVRDVIKALVLLSRRGCRNSKVNYQRLLIHLIHFTGYVRQNQQRRQPRQVRTTRRVECKPVFVINFKGHNERLYVKRPNKGLRKGKIKCRRF